MNNGRADQLGSGIRNLYKFTKLYSGGEPELIEGDIFKTIIPLVSVSGKQANKASGKSKRIKQANKTSEKRMPSWDSSQNTARLWSPNLLNYSA
jgi:ATP-dependent DNA helicase RecG